MLTQINLSSVKFLDNLSKRREKINQALTERAREFGGGVLFYKGTNPFLKVSALYLVACLKHNVGSTASIASDSL